jgi:hypothetical protein
MICKLIVAHFYRANGKEWSPASDVKPPTKLQFNLTNDVSKSLTLAKENSARYQAFTQYSLVTCST